jgi:Ca-activated chloride channel family protein
MNHDGHDVHEGGQLRRAFMAVVFVVFVVVSSFAAQTFRARIDAVQVTVTVVAADGRLITGLTKDDFEILEDDVPQTITQFTDERVPVSLGVLLDASDSMRGQPIVDARGAVNRFVGGLLESGDEVFMAAFNHQPHLVAPWTQPPVALRGRLDSFRPTGGTAIYDALVASAPMFGRRIHTRAALVLVSDGADTASDLTLRQARAILRRTDPFVYAIAIDAPGALLSTRVNPEALREITAQSGGYTEVVRSAEDLGPATERIANELNKQYLLGYVSSRPPDDSWRAIRVKVKNGSYFTRARRGYYALRR